MGTFAGMTTPALPVPLRRTASAALVATALVHVAIVGEYLREARYLGVLFILGAAAAVWAAARLWRGRDVAAWIVGAIVCAGMFVGFLLSRTVGLPGFHEEEWELSGLLSLALEAGFLVLFAAARPFASRSQRTAAVR